jgi:hypothetical protein
VLELCGFASETVCCAHTIEGPLLGDAAAGQQLVGGGVAVRLASRGAGDPPGSDGVLVVLPRPLRVLPMAGDLALEPLVV